jgi:ABC-type glycerol-3-phosphate transport system permease component
MLRRESDGAIIVFFVLLLAWTDYLGPAVLLAMRNMTVAATQGQLFGDTDAAWNTTMAAPIRQSCRRACRSCRM